MAGCVGIWVKLGNMPSGRLYGSDIILFVNLN